MLIDFENLKKMTVSQMNGGTGSVEASLCMLPLGKAIYSSIAPHASIGLHTHATSTDINYVLQGSGVAVCDGTVEELRPGVCHICPKGSSHSLQNNGDEPMCLFTVVVEG